MFAPIPSSTAEKKDKKATPSLLSTIITSIPIIETSTCNFCPNKAPNSPFSQGNSTNKDTQEMKIPSKEDQKLTYFNF